MTAAQPRLKHQHRSDGNWRERPGVGGVMRYYSRCIDCGIGLTTSKKPPKKKNV